ncbi:MAG TPA: tRNA (adenosine(37)-N6)-threonylcarbamoyltransferase complex transferase subunit TsaD [Dissulfurispiraceae bacterium]|nr:tRNA (adenosine(37)-N6)-threonylcarbamoyltransferase complex transferase subunit TsaD [Dissulfurispiraceae bacterium]
MMILGIDTSCDDTSAAVVRNGREIVSNIVSSQTEIHQKYGGIVPELASRRHSEMIWPVVQEALSVAGIALEGLTAIAVCYGPGLVGSLLIGCGFAKAVSFARSIPLVAVNHLEGHIFAAFLEDRAPDFPFLALIVSGGHTSLYMVKSFGTYLELGRTRDDAAGEAYDKVSKLLGMNYPGGPIIDRLAREGNPTAFVFPRAYLPESMDFSFSGVKTAVRNQIQKTVNKGKEPLSEEFRRDIAASFQAAVVDVLVRKVQRAIQQIGIRRIVLSGGVAANSALRVRMQQMASEHDAELYMPSIRLCADNAAMIAAAGYHHFLAGERAHISLNAKAYLPLGTAVVNSEK